MNHLWSFSLILLAFFVQQRVCTELRPQIKPVGCQANYVNPAYTKGLVVTISKVNGTSNNLKLYWNVIKDVPADVTLRVKVFVTDSTYQGGSLVLDTEVPLCTESKNRHLLPSVLVVPDVLLNTQCLKKAVINQLSQQFRFEVLVPGLEKIGTYYRADYTFRNPKEDIVEITTFSEWGYLNNN